jgi:hypothetical protein
LSADLAVCCLSLSDIHVRWASPCLAPANIITATFLVLVNFLSSGFHMFIVTSMVALTVNIDSASKNCLTQRHHHVAGFMAIGCHGRQRSSVGTQTVIAKSSS